MTADTVSGLRSEVRLLLHRGRQVWGLIPRKHKVALGLAGLVMAATSVCNTAMPLLLGSLVDGVKTGTEEGWSGAALFRLAGFFLGLIAIAYIAREGLNVLRRYLVENSITRINRDMSVKLLAHQTKVDLGKISSDRVGTLHGKIFRSVDGFVRFMRLSFLDFLPALLTGLFALVAALTRQPLLGLAMLGVAPMAVYLTVRQLLSQKGVRLQLMRACEEIDGTVVEVLGGMEYIRASNTHKAEMDRLTRSLEARRKKEIRHHFQMSLFGCGKALNEGFFHILVLGLAIYLAIQGKATFGDVLMFSVLFLNIMAPLNEIHRVLDEGHEASLRVGDLLEMLNEPIDRSFVTVGGKLVPLQPGEPVIEIDNLRVEYLTLTGEHKVALDGISLTIRHGETIGVAGPSGSGKSTWIKALLRLLHPVEGRVKLCGVPLEEVSREELARLIGYVGQVPFVFSGTVMENIIYGKGDASPIAVQQAAELAHLHHEILALPDGYAAEITERGQNLSGGQRQRLAIARMLLQQSPILILDEATSALDNISERHVQRSLGLTSTDRTTILVAHRLSTLRDANRILVFDGGKIVEVGTYHDLVQRGGLFTELVMSGEKSLLDEEPAAAGCGR